MSPTDRFRCAITFAALTLLAPAAHGEDAPKGKRYALLIGINEYQSDKLRSLKFAENDAEGLGKVLTQSGFDEVRVLTNTRGKKDKKDAPTAQNIRKALEELTKGKGKEDMALIAISGHGMNLEVPDPDRKGKAKTYAYLCPADADLTDKVSYSTGKCASLVNINELFGAVKECGARHKLLLLDTSAGIETTEKVAFLKGAGVLLSCSKGGRAYETPKFAHGVFTHYVLEGLRGKASNRNGEVTWATLTAYVTEKVEKAVPEIIGGGARQVPHAINNIEGASPVLVRKAKGKPKD